MDGGQRPTVPQMPVLGCSPSPAPSTPSLVQPALPEPGAGELQPTLSSQRPLSPPWAHVMAHTSVSLWPLPPLFPGKCSVYNIIKSLALLLQALPAALYGDQDLGCTYHRLSSLRTPTGPEHTVASTALAAPPPRPGPQGRRSPPFAVAVYPLLCRAPEVLSARWYGG